MSKGSVHDLLYGSGKTPLSFKRKMLIAKQAALGMNWYIRALTWLVPFLLLGAHRTRAHTGCIAPSLRSSTETSSQVTHTTHTHQPHVLSFG
jgi:hypothetical protein